MHRALRRSQEGQRSRLRLLEQRGGREAGTAIVRENAATGSQDYDRFFLSHYDPDSP